MRTGTASSTARASCWHRRSSTRTCTCAPPGAKTRRRSPPVRPPPPPAATARSSRCRTPTPVVDTPDVLRGLRARAEQEAAIPVGFTAAITMGQAGHPAHRDGRARRRRGGGLHRRRPAGRKRRPDAAGARVQRDHRPAPDAPLRGADAHPRRAHAHGRGVGRARPRRLAVARREPRRRPRAGACRRHRSGSSI